MKFRGYIAVIFLLVFAVSATFIASCVNEKKAKEDSAAMEKTTTEEPKAEESKPMESKPVVSETPAEAPKGPTYKNLLDDTQMSFDDFKGHVLIINVWDTWCPPCKMEIPAFVDLQEKYKDQKFSFIGVAGGRYGEDAVKKSIVDLKINYPVIMLTKELQKNYEKAIGQPIRSIPTTLVLNKDGSLANVYAGAPARTPQGVFDIVDAEIKELLAKE